MAQEKIEVCVDPDLADLIPGFLENRRRDILAITEAIARGDIERVRMIGHSMKGTGGGYGFDAITEFGEILEQGARTLDMETVKRVVAELREYLERIVVVYD